MSQVVKAKAAQHRVHPTGGSRPVFWQFLWLEVGSGKVAFPPPAHPWVTHPVGQFIQIGLLKLFKTKACKLYGSAV